MKVNNPAEKLPDNLADLLRRLPPFLDPDGVREHIAPIGRTMLYELATLGEIETASLGLGRGRRVFVTASILAWIARRQAVTKRPNLAARPLNKS